MRLNQGNSTLRVCVDNVTGGQISGRVMSQRLEKPLLFADIGNLLLQTEELLDEQDYPRAFQRKRSFGAEQTPTAPPPVELLGDFMSKETVEQSRGEISTFVINVITRQNTSWQGKIDWLDGQTPQSFKSALELIRMVNEAIVKQKPVD